MICVVSAEETIEIAIVGLGGVVCLAGIV